MAYLTLALAPSATPLLLLSSPGPDCSPAYPSVQTVRWAMNKYSAVDSSNISSTTPTK